MLTLTYRRGLERRTGSLMSMLHAHINVPMDGPRCRNIFGAFALMISDDIVRATSSRAPEAGPAASALALLAHEPGLRSEEHTSELQSLMRISYAVFCLKKKKSTK